MAETYITCAFTLAGSVIGSYVFAAVWEVRGNAKYLGSNAAAADKAENS